MKFLLPGLLLFMYYIQLSPTDDFSLHSIPLKDAFQEKSLTQSVEDGQVVYSEFCMRCHLANGEGVEDVYPPLANSDWLEEKREASIKSVKYGLKGEIIVNGKTYNNNMTSMGLTDREVADVMNYIMHNFGNETKNHEQVTLDEVKSLSND